MVNSAVRVTIDGMEWLYRNRDEVQWFLDKQGLSWNDAVHKDYVDVGLVEYYDIDFVI